MMTAKILVAALVSGAMASSAMAAGFFVGGEAGVTSHPDFASSAAQSMINAGFTSSAATQDKGATAVGVYGGQWVTDNFGWEASITSLGSVKGRVNATTGALTTTFHYKYTAGALNAAVLGGVRLGPAGRLYGKAGLYAAGVTYDGPIRMTTKGSVGLVIGGGYSISFAEHLTGKAELAIYNNVEFPAFDFNTFTDTTSSNDITKLSIGLAYAF